MGQGPRTEAAAVVAVVALVLCVRAAIADPILSLPTVGKGTLIGDAPVADAGAPARGDEPIEALTRVRLALTAEMSALAILGADRTTTYPEVGGIRGAAPELALMRVGLVGQANATPIGFALRVDAAEGLRLGLADFDARPGAALDRLVDDAALVWAPRAWFAAWLGRLPVAFSRFRQLEHGDLTGVAVPFVIDRIAPERRWGAAVAGDLGGIAYAAGGFEDTDGLEARALSTPDDQRAVADPSRGDRALLAIRAEWTPRAPHGRGLASAAPGDPWFAIPRISVGAGVLHRWRGGGRVGRTDLSLSGSAKLERLAGAFELVLSLDHGEVALAPAGEASFLIGQRWLLFGQGELDAELARWSAGGGLSYYVTADRLNRIAFVGFVRRDTDGGGLPHDGAIVQLQANL